MADRQRRRKANKMGDELSINPEKSNINLSDNAADNSLAVFRVAASNVPIVGSIFQEIFSSVIPNQKHHRMRLFAEVLDQKIGYMEQDVLRLKMKTEEFVDLLEDAVPQAARAMTDERREYIASFLKTSLTDDELTHLQQKKLLAMLNELNDAEIIFLRYKSLVGQEQEDFWETHKNLLSPIPVVIRGERSGYDKEAFRRSYQSKLFELGLMERRFNRLKKGEMPEFDEKTGMMKSQNDSLSGIGHLLLRYIGHPSSLDKRRNRDDF